MRNVDFGMALWTPSPPDPLSPQGGEGENSRCCSDPVVLPSPLEGEGEGGSPTSRRQVAP
jgi:hypothetical protein